MRSAKQSFSRKFRALLSRTVAVGVQVLHVSRGCFECSKKRRRHDDQRKGAHAMRTEYSNLWIKAEGLFNDDNDGAAGRHRACCGEKIRRVSLVVGIDPRASWLVLVVPRTSGISCTPSSMELPINATSCLLRIFSLRPNSVFPQNLHWRAAWSTDKCGTTDAVTTRHVVGVGDGVNAFRAQQNLAACAFIATAQIHKDGSSGGGGVPGGYGRRSTVGRPTAVPVRLEGQTEDVKSTKQGNRYKGYMSGGCDLGP